MATASLEAILQRLLVPDNNVIQQATKELKEVYKNPNVVPALCECLAGSDSPQVRQYASILLRRRLVKLWKKMTAVDKASIKQHILTALSKETERPVRRTLAQLVAVVASEELNGGRWNDIYTFIECNANSGDPGEREVAMMLLNNILEITPEPFQSKFSTLLNLFASTLQDASSKLVPYYTIKCMTAIVEFIGEDHMEMFRALIPVVLQVLRVLVTDDDDYACEAMELFDELIESEVSIITPMLPSVIGFLLEVGKDSSLGDSVRVKAFSVLSWLVSTKKKVISQRDMLCSVLTTILSILVTGHDTVDEEDEESVDEDLDEVSPYASAAKLLDNLALNLNPKILFPVLVQMVQPWFVGDDPKQHKAAILSMAIICEGCSEYIRENGQTQGLLEFVYGGLQHSSSSVRNVSLFAIGQFSENLQPNIGQYASSILPVLLDHLVKVVASFPNQARTTRSLTKAFYALELFCENLGAGIVQYMPTVMEKVIQVYYQAQGLAIKEHIVSTFGAVANAAEQEFLPYFPQVVKILEECLSLQAQPNMVILHGQAIDTLGVLARTVGRENFLPLVPNCMELGKNGMKSTDPDLRRSVYGMFASLSTILKEDMAGDLQEIVIQMLETLQTDEGVKVHYDEPGAGGLFNFNDIDDDDEDDDENDLEDNTAFKGVSVENAYLEEKEDACNALGEIALHTGTAFLSHFDDVFREITLLLDHTSSNVRKASSSSLGQLCEAWLSLWDTLSDSDRVELNVLLNTTLQALVSAATLDMEKLVAIVTLEATDNILRACKGRVQLEPKTAKVMLEGIQQFLKRQAMCQCGAEDCLLDMCQCCTEDDEAEVDRLLTEGAGSLIPPLVALIGAGQVMAEVEAFITNTLKSLSPNSSVSERSYSVGTIGELLDAMGLEAVRFSRLMDVFLLYLTDQESEVRSNAAFGVGVLAANAHTALSAHYGMVLQKLFAQVERESDARTIDNIVAAVCRMITVKPDCVPLDQVRQPFYICSNFSFHFVLKK
jgi:hypothetical protein